MDDYTKNIKKGRLTNFTLTNCSDSQNANKLLQEYQVDTDHINCDAIRYDAQKRKPLDDLSHMKTFPKIFIGTSVLGSDIDLKGQIHNGDFFKKLDAEGIHYILPNGNKEFAPDGKQHSFIPAKTETGKEGGSDCVIF